MYEIAAVVPCVQCDSIQQCVSIVHFFAIRYCTLTYQAIITRPFMFYAVLQGIKCNKGYGVPSFSSNISDINCTFKACIASL